MTYVRRRCSSVPGSCVIETAKGIRTRKDAGRPSARRSSSSSPSPPLYRDRAHASRPAPGPALYQHLPCSPPAFAASFSLVSSLLLSSSLPSTVLAFPHAGPPSPLLSLACGSSSEPPPLFSPVRPPPPPRALPSPRAPAYNDHRPEAAHDARRHGLRPPAVRPPRVRARHAPVHPRALDGAQQEARGRQRRLLRPGHRTLVPFNLFFALIRDGGAGRVREARPTVFWQRGRVAGRVVVPKARPAPAASAMRLTSLRCRRARRARLRRPRLSFADLPGACSVPRSVLEPPPFTLGAALTPLASDAQ